MFVENGSGEFLGLFHEIRLVIEYKIELLSIIKSYSLRIKKSITGNWNHVKKIDRIKVERDISYHVLYIWDFVVSFIPAKSARWEAEIRDVLIMRKWTFVRGRRRPDWLLTQASSLKHTQTAKRAAGERALCVLRHPRPSQPLPRSIDILPALSFGSSS